MKEIVCLIIAIIVIIFLIANRSKTNPPAVQPEDTPSEVREPDFTKAYQQKYLFSLNEKNEFRKLLDWAELNNFYVFPKMRLLDIIEPRKNADNYKALFWKIQAKHVDFVICDRDLKIQHIIELDDNSHNRKNRVERDEFVSQALSGAGYTLNHTKGISDEFLNNLKK